MGLKSMISKSILAASSPINVLDFAQSLVRLLPKAAYDHGYEHGVLQRQRQIGLAISGGVDSMALALLCSQLKGIHSSQFQDEETSTSWKQLQQTSFRAFVVNHGVREGSLQEAQSVAKVLLQRDIATEVLNIGWNSKDGEFPAKQPNFESLARKYRFQTLGRVCYRHGISALLLAHHQDDQAETLLMRLVNGHGMLGLTGIKSEAAIPECHGIYGVHESGQIMHEVIDSNNFTASVATQKNQLNIAYGGVKIYRPLLDFSKDRLRATCLAGDMNWFEDHTNQDPTLTMRNAVRKLYRSHKMPVALSKPALLELSTRASKNAASKQDIVDDLLAKCKLFRLETRSGILHIRFPDLTTLRSDVNQEHNLHLIAAILLRRIIILVTPNEHIELSTLCNLLPTIFPELSTVQTISHSVSTKQTIAGVQFDPLPSISTTSSKHQKPTWLLSRQNLARSKNPVLLTISPNTASSWTLLDNRYWLRIKPYPKQVTIKLLTPSLLARFRDDLDHDTRKRLNLDLKDIAPGNIRWTLLACVLEGRVISLPSLGHKIDYEKGEKEVLKVEILYKKVDLGGLRIGQGQVVE